MASGTTIEQLFLSLGLDMTQLDSDLLTASKTVQQGMADLTRKAAQTKIKLDIDMAGFDNAGNSVDALAVKEKALTAQQDIQRQKIALVNATYQESVQAKGADSIASEKLLTRLLAEQRAEQNLAQQIRQTNQARENAIKQNQENIVNKSIGNSRTITDTQKVKMDIDLASLKAGENSLTGLKLKSEQLSAQLTSQKNTVYLLNKAHLDAVVAEGEHSAAAQKYLSELQKEQLAEAKLAQQIRQTNQERSKKVTDNVGTGMDVVTGVTAPFAALGAGALKLAVDSTEYENLWKVSMGKMEVEGREWSEGLRKDLGVNDYEMRKQAGTFNVMFDSMGMGTQKSYDLATSLTKLSLDMSSFYHIPIAEMQEKITAGMVGMSRPLEQLGIIVKDANVNTYAYTHGIADFGQELTDQQLVLARYGTIMDQTTRAQGDLARTSGSSANKIRSLKGDIDELGIEFGKTLLPALDEFLDTGKAMAKWYENTDEGNKNVANSITKVGVEVGTALIALRALSMLFIPVSPWFALAAAVGLATKGLVDYVEKDKELKEIEESKSLGSDPSSEKAKLRLNPDTGDLEKEVIKTVDVMGHEIPRLPIWMKLEGQELVEAEAKRVTAQIIQARREQLESITEASTGKPLSKEHIDETLKDEFDKDYSDKKWKENFDRDQDEANKKAMLDEAERQKRLQANQSLNTELFKLENDDFNNSLQVLQDKTREFQKQKVDEVTLSKWVEEEKKKITADAQKEYLSGLDKFRQDQINASMGAVQTNAIKQDMPEGQLNLQELENQQETFNTFEKTANSARLAERLAVIQEMTEGEEVGSRRRKELLEQEVSTSNEYSKSLVDGIKSAMSEIENLQNKELSSASTAVGALDKFQDKVHNFATGKDEFTKSNNSSFLSQIAKDAENAWNETSSHTMSQINQIQELKEKLAKDNINLDVDIRSSDVMDAYKNSIKGIPDSIAQAKTSMADFYTQIENLGSSSIERYFQEWRSNLDTLKSEMGGGNDIADGNYFSRQPIRELKPPSQADINMQTNGYSGSDVQGITVNDNLTNAITKLSQSIQSIGGVSGNNSPPIAKTQPTAGNGINLNLQNSVEFKGFTQEEMSKTVEMAKDAFGQELLTALQNAQAQYGG